MKGGEFVAKTWRVRLAVTALLLAGAVFVSALVGTVSSNPRSRLAYTKANLVRLHVVANSNSPSDQELKLDVRDRILEVAGKLVRKSRTQSEAIAALQRNIPQLEGAATDVVRTRGRNYPVKVHLGEFAFPERKYGRLVLPAGTYQALRVTLGEGKGRNWWCVLFPPLCLIDSSLGPDGPDGTIHRETAGQATRGARPRITISPWLSGKLLRPNYAKKVWDFLGRLSEPLEARGTL